MRKKRAHFEFLTQFFFQPGSEIEFFWESFNVLFSPIKFNVQNYLDSLLTITDEGARQFVYINNRQKIYFTILQIADIDTEMYPAFYGTGWKKRAFG